MVTQASWRPPGRRGTGCPRPEPKVSVCSRLGERESSLGDAPHGREPGRQEPSQELPRESGFGIYEFLVSIQKDSRPQVLWRGSFHGAKTPGGREAASSPGTVLCSLRPDSGLTNSFVAGQGLELPYDLGQRMCRRGEGHVSLVLNSRRSVKSLKSISEGRKCHDSHAV